MESKYCQPDLVFTEANPIQHWKIWYSTLPRLCSEVWFLAAGCSTSWLASRHHTFSSYSDLAHTYAPLIHLQAPQFLVCPFDFPQQWSQLWYLFTLPQDYNNHNYPVRLLPGAKISPPNYFQGTGNGSSVGYMANTIFLLPTRGVNWHWTRRYLFEAELYYTRWFDRYLVIISLVKSNHAP